MSRVVWCCILLSACGCRRLQELGAPATAETSVAPVPVVFAGVIVDGRFRDRDGRFSIDVPPGWTARPGVDGEPLRLTLRHAASGAVVEVRRSPGDDLTPRPRAGCTWLFEDEGPYRALRVAGPVGAATCLPDDPAGRRAFAWLYASDGSTWSLDVLPTSAQMLAGLDAGEAVLATARWRAAPELTRP